MRTYNIKPIKTMYNNYKFRSRLEARWAVFFDAMGIEYQYEPRLFNLGKLGYYLPDFYLPVTQNWVEVKPSDLHETEYLKILAVSKQTKQDGLMLIGQPRAKPYYGWVVGKDDVIEHTNFILKIDKRYYREGKFLRNIVRIKYDYNPLLTPKYSPNSSLFHRWYFLPLIRAVKASKAIKFDKYIYSPHPLTPPKIIDYVRLIFGGV